ncbi:hypothetical protein [Aeromonas hydrophila]|uniref:hypothetical protein n=1 Tax=Aeromonas hydrophila TaxID=644 RepID=UPI0018EF35AD
MTKKRSRHSGGLFGLSGFVEAVDERFCVIDDELLAVDGGLRIELLAVQIGVGEYPDTDDKCRLVGPAATAVYQALLKPLMSAFA